MTNPISACIITHNEEGNLARALRSLAGIADEVVVVDSGSTDRSMEIAREHGANVHGRAWSNYSEQKNFAAERARHNWILSLDADEELSAALQSSVLQWKQQDPRATVYEMSRRTWYLGAWIRHSGWYPDFQRRLYRRDAARFAGLVHEALRFDGCPVRLEGDLLHYTIRSFAEHEDNVEKYTTLAAEELHACGKRSWRGGAWLAPGWSFLQNFVLRGGFLDGYRGWLISRMAARSVHLKYSKLGRLLESDRRAEAKA